MTTIAITQRVERNKYGKEVDSLEHDYVKYYAKFGVALVPIPNSLGNIKDYLDSLSLDGIILSGGGDIHPSLYGKSSRKGFEYFPERDHLEKKVLEFAVKNNVPLLGECRGMQFLNVFFGGSLLENVNDMKGIRHAGTTHEVDITDVRARKYFHKSSLAVNSFHNQGFSKEEVASSLKIFAEAADGTVEGVYHPAKPIAGIMWHPERGKMRGLFNAKLIEAFIKRKLYWKK
ncbi:MAG: type 1 glutamine amidotransferase [Candidatus Paceibacterota bacterium]|jgi:putative glutamine amidotransferase